MEKIKKILNDSFLGLFSAVPLSDCIITRQYKLERAGFSPSEKLFVIVLAVPYLTKQSRRNLSAYAVCRDYHLFFKELFSTIFPRLEREFEGYRFACFADDSPIDERDAAAKAGLGIIGDNGMLITEKYSSYVFLGEIITNMPIDCAAQPIKRCIGCGRCKDACPMNETDECMSSLTQKKGELTDAEQGFIKKYGSVWGCDICQEVCPHTLRAIKNQTIYTDIEFFKSDPIPCLTLDILDSMSDEDFSKRAYSWRKRETIRRNLEIIEE